MSTGNRIALSIGGGVIAAPASYVVQRFLGAWGVLDDVSDALGAWFKLNVPPAAAGWTIALVFVIAIYGVVLWRVWSPPRHIHHVTLPSKTEPVATMQAEVTKANRLTEAEREGCSAALLEAAELLAGPIRGHVACVGAAGAAPQKLPQAVADVEQWRVDSDRLRGEVDALCDRRQYCLSRVDLDLAPVSLGLRALHGPSIAVHQALGWPPDALKLKTDELARANGELSNAVDAKLREIEAKRKEYFS